MCMYKYVWDVSPYPMRPTCITARRGTPTVHTSWETRYDMLSKHCAVLGHNYPDYPGYVGVDIPGIGIRYQSLVYSSHLGYGVAYGSIVGCKRNCRPKNAGESRQRRCGETLANEGGCTVRVAAICYLILACLVLGPLG